MYRRKVVASVQVRMSSSRLPGKTMLEVKGKPLLGYLLGRLQQCNYLDEIVVATSIRPENDQIEEYCQSSGVNCFRGSEEDVLERTLMALESHSAEIGVEVFGDGPLIDPALVDELVCFFLENRGYDFVGNDLETTYPPGMEVEVFRVSALADSAKKTKTAGIREHGTLFLRTNPEIYCIKNIRAPKKLRRPDLELEVDTIEDFQVIRCIIEHFQGRMDFSLEEMIGFLDENESIKSMNQDIPRRWKEFRRG